MEKRYIKSDDDGDNVFISDNGIEYSMYEGISMGIEPKTSDIVFFMLDGYDCNTELVYWSYGANILHPDDVESIARIIKAWEDEHKDLIADIKNGTIEKY